MSIVSSSHGLRGGGADYCKIKKEIGRAKEVEFAIFRALHKNEVNYPVLKDGACKRN